MNKQKLINLIKSKRSFLCVGLDPDINKLPKRLLSSEDPIFEFNKQIIDATIDLAVAYKPNLAFYESTGIKGWQSFEKTINYLNENYKDEVFTIADAKRGDIGNTSAQYAKAFLSPEGFDFDSITVAPYMGSDSVSPFLTIEDKWIILLALTSNSGAQDFQYLQDSSGKQLFEHVLEKATQWGTDENTMFVIGATKAEKLKQIRQIIPNHFLLVPGVGAQGGCMKEVAKYGMNTDCGLLVNASRSILYASNDTDFSEKARVEALSMQVEMDELLKEKNI